MRGQPFVFLPIGLPGAGKSSLVLWLAERLRCRILSRDSLREAMFNPCSFTESEKRAAYAGLQVALRSNLSLSESTLVDGMCFSSVGVLEDLEGIAEEYNAVAIPVWCDCPIAVAQERVECDRRLGRHAAQDRDAALVRRVAERFRVIPEGVLRIDMSQDRDTIGHLALEHICRRLSI